MKHHSQTIDLSIRGMHCASCEVMIERKFKKVPGVDSVSVNHATGRARLQCRRSPDIRELQKAIDGHGYTVVDPAQDAAGEATQRTAKRDMVELGAVFLIVVAAYLILRQFKLVPDIGVEDSMGYGFVFVIGLVAALSTCMAVTGGLLVAVAATYAKEHPYLTGWQRFKPNMYFNIGRVAGYTVFGGIVGALGSVLTLSTKVTGIVTVIASLVMILLGFQLLHLFPGLRRLQPKMPKFLAHRIHEAASADRKAAPVLFGASTFFLPCGFTQALQLYVLSKGDWKAGALTMLIFSLGTLPALLSLSALSSFMKGAKQRYFLKTAGVVVVLLGLTNIRNGFVLAGFAVGGVPKTATTTAASDPNVALLDGVQVINMAVNGYSYQPAQFTVQRGVPVRWNIDATRAGGCARVLIAPDLDLQQYLSSSGTTAVTFTPTSVGTFRFGCPMGMTTPGAAVTVVENDGSVRPSPSGPGAAPCNPEVQNCAEDARGAFENGGAQKISMTVTREQGFSPNSFAVKKDEPVEWTIDDQIRLGGCMGTLVIPELGVVKRLDLGENIVRFTPTKKGRMLFTCSMGTPLGEFNVSS